MLIFVVVSTAKIRIFYVPVCFFLRSDPDVKQETTGSGKQKYCYLIHSLQDVSGILLNTGWGTFARLLMVQFTSNEGMNNNAPK